MSHRHNPHAARRKKSSTTARFRTCIVIKNPRSTHYHQVEAWLRTLQRVWPKTLIETVETSGNNTANDMARLAQVLQKSHGRTIIIIGGGDGTCNTVVDFLVNYPRLTDEQRQTPILPLWGGNANDLACMLNGPVGKKSLATIVAHGEVVKMHPLLCETQSGRSRQAQLAMNYVSFGVTAQVAEKLNRRSHRRQRSSRIPLLAFLRDAYAAIHTFVTASPFKLRDSQKEKQAYERVFINGSRMARIERFPVQLTDNYFLQTTLTSRPATLAAVPILRAGRQPFQEIHGSVSFTLAEATWAQFDGEPQLLQANTQVMIRKHPQAVRAVSTRLQK